MCLLVSWCVGGECNMAGNDEDRGRSKRLCAEDQEWSGTSRVLSGRTIGRSGDAMCDPHHTRGGDEKCRFPSLASKRVGIVCQWFDLKTTATISWFGTQNQGRRFGDLGLKITATISWFWPQNHVVCRFAPQNRWADKDGVRTRVDIWRLASSWSNSV
jgi:hypothetical protein